MKACIITFHNVSNFGATLQCVALNKACLQLGLQVDVIDYMPPYVREKKGAFKGIGPVLRQYHLHGNLKRFVRQSFRRLGLNVYYLQNRARQNKFDRFLLEHVTCTRCYTSYESLKRNPPTADLYLSGSDQIWNASLTGGMFDSAFFLRFAPEVARKIAYGTSFGETDIAANSDALRTLTAGYRAIATRERSSAQALEAALGRSVETVVDPVLLLEPEAYEAFETPVSTQGPYVLVYNVQNSARAVRIAQEAARVRGLDIIDLSPNPFRHVKGARKHIGIGPAEFLSYIRQASYIVTNSFHGMVFALLFQKEFTAIPSLTRPGRMMELLKAVDLENRVAKEEDASSLLTRQIDYARVSAEIEVMRKKSIRFLSRIICP